MAVELIGSSGNIADVDISGNLKVNIEASAGAITIAAGSALIGQVEVSDGTNVIGTLAHPMYVTGALSDADLIDAGNSSTVALGSNGVFTGTSHATAGYAQLIVAVDSDQAASNVVGISGIVVQWSEDGTNWGDIDWASFTSTDAGEGQGVSFPIKRPYYRMVYTNGAVAQTYFRLQSILKVAAASGRLMDLIDAIDPNAHAQLVRNIGFGHSAYGTGIFNDITVKNPSTVAAATDPSLVVALSPNSPIPTGTNLVGQVEVSDGTNILFTSGHAGYVQFASAQSISGTVTANQGTAAALSAYWPVGLSDGTNLIGGSGHPIYAQFGSAQAVTLTSTTITGSVTVQQPTGSNLHTVVDSGTLTTVSTVTAVTSITNAVTVAQGTAANLKGEMILLDAAGTNLGTIKAASSQAAATDTSLVVQINPNQPAFTTALNVHDSAPASQAVTNIGTFAVQDNLTQYAGSSLTGTVTAYGTAPTGNVFGVNAYVTNTPAVTVSSGSITATQGTGSNLHTVVDSGSITATQATGSNLHTVVDSGTITVSSITTMPALVTGAATIGKVDILGNSGVVLDAVLGAAKPANVLQVGGNDGTNAYAVPLGPSGRAVIVEANNSSTANAPAQQTVGVASGSILAANASRKECLVVNTGTTIVYLGLGQTPSATAYHVALSPCTSANDGTGGTYTSDMWKGSINAIGSAAAGTVCVTELT